MSSFSGTINLLTSVERNGLTDANQSVNQAVSDDKHQLLSWNDQSAGYEYTLDGQMDPTRSYADMDDVSLGEFFERPLTIRSFEWSPSLTLYEDFNPWTDFITNPRISNRLNNFSLARAKLHVKFMINGNAFYYGRALASYNPLSGFDQLTLNRALIPQDLIAASQRPHVYIDPTTNQGGEIECPFFYFEDMLNNVTDWGRMGRMSLREVNPLRHANGATDPITITVLAWMTDVTLAAPTAKNMNLLLPQSGFEAQAGMEKSKTKKKQRVTKTTNGGSNSRGNNYAKQDEFGTGPVSGPASSIAKVAGMLTKAPFIGPYAKATEIAMSGISNVARIFGYSRAPTLADTKSYNYQPNSQLAVANIPDNCERLVMDAKQELSVDPAIVGLSSIDEMTIKSVACRESYLTSFAWTTGNAPEEELFSIGVCPRVFASVTAPDEPTEYHFPPCGFAANCFQWWRGTMRFRFQIVSSAYHKGRLKIQWDPQGYTNNETNVQYTQIVDISDEKDFTIEVGWGNELGWLETFTGPTGTSFTDYVNPWNKGLGGFSGSRNVYNGSLTVSVLNSLTSPSASAGGTVEVNCIVSCGDDIEFAVPYGTLIDQVSYYKPNPVVPPRGGPPELEPQSGMENMPVVQEDKDCTDEPSKPIQDSSLVTMGATTDNTDNNALVYHGEAVTSFRSLCKRYQYVGVLPAGEEGFVSSRATIYSYPPHPGDVGNDNVTWGNFIAGDTTNYNENTFIAYLKGAYAGIKGGMKWRAQLITRGNQKLYNSAFYISRVFNQANPGTYSNNALPEPTTGTDVYKASRDLRLASLDGMAITPPSENPVVQAEIPFQQNVRFSPSTRTAAKNASFDRDPRLIVGFTGSNTNTVSHMAAMFCSASEDFNLHFFTSVPVMWLRD